MRYLLTTCLIALALGAFVTCGGGDDGGGGGPGPLSGLSGSYSETISLSLANAASGYEELNDLTYTLNMELSQYSTNYDDIYGTWEDSEGREGRVGGFIDPDGSFHIELSTSPGNVLVVSIDGTADDYDIDGNMEVSLDDADFTGQFRSKPYARPAGYVHRPLPEGTTRIAAPSNLRVSLYDREGADESERDVSEAPWIQSEDQRAMLIQSDAVPFASGYELYFSQSPEGPWNRGNVSQNGGQLITILQHCRKADPEDMTKGADWGFWSYQPNVPYYFKLKTVSSTSCRSDVSVSQVSELSSETATGQVVVVDGSDNPIYGVIKVTNDSEFDGTWIRTSKIDEDDVEEFLAKEATRPDGARHKLAPITIGFTGGPMIYKNEFRKGATYAFARKPGTYLVTAYTEGKSVTSSDDDWEYGEGFYQTIVTVEAGVEPVTWKTSERHIPYAGGSGGNGGGGGASLGAFSFGQTVDAKMVSYESGLSFIDVSVDETGLFAGLYTYPDSSQTTIDTRLDISIDSSVYVGNGQYAIDDSTVTVQFIDSRDDTGFRLSSGSVTISDGPNGTKIMAISSIGDPFILGSFTYELNQ